MVYTPSISADVTMIAPSTSAPWPRPMPLSESSMRAAAIAVMMPIGRLTKEDPVPADRLRDQAAGEQPHSRTGRGNEAEDAECLGALERLREKGDDHGEDHGRAHRSADTLDEARADQHRLREGKSAKH